MTSSADRNWSDYREFAAAAHLLERQTLGSVLRNTFRIYGQYWSTVVGITVPPILPFLALRLLLTGIGSGYAIIAIILEYLVIMFMTPVLCIAISDICLGIKPSVTRSYRRALQTKGLIKTYLVFGATLLVGFILLVVPGIIASVLYVFSLPITVIEKRAGWNAMRRSRELGKGHYLRNFGVYLVCYLVVYLAMLVVVVAAILVLVFLLDMNSDIGGATGSVVGELLGVLISPLLLTPYILLYYDMRARKEGYGPAQLAEELRV